MNRRPYARKLGHKLLCQRGKRWGKRWDKKRENGGKPAAVRGRRVHLKDWRLFNPRADRAEKPFLVLSASNACRSVDLHFPL